MDTNDNSMFSIAADGNTPNPDQVWWMSLGAIKAMSARLKEKVALFDEHGFRKGTVYPDGTVQS